MILEAALVSGIRPPATNEYISASTLTEGREYRILKEFSDYDGRLHAIGERWNPILWNFQSIEDPPLESSDS